MERNSPHFQLLKPKGIPHGHPPPPQGPPVGNTIRRAKGFISNHSLDARVSLCPLLNAGWRCKSIPDQAALAGAAAAAAAAAAAPSTGREEGGRQGRLF